MGIHTTQNTYTDSKLTAQKEFFFAFKKEKSQRFSVAYIKVSRVSVCVYTRSGIRYNNS